MRRKTGTLDGGLYPDWQSNSVQARSVYLLSEPALFIQKSREMMMSWLITHTSLGCA
jgi:hypothetical protein